MPSAAAPRPPRVFISRTTTGLAGLGDEIAAILRVRGAEPVVQSGFLPDWRSVPQMLQDQLHSCDSVIALIGPAHGGGPDRPPAPLRDERTHDRPFSFTQWEYLVARDLRRPVFTFLVSGPDLVEHFEPEDPALAARQQAFIADFAKDRAALYYEYTERAILLDHVWHMELPINVSAGRPCNLPEPIGTLFIGRADFMTSLRATLAAGETTVIRSKQAVHGMGGVGKTRAAIEYGWDNAARYNALLFVTADSPEALDRNLAALCGPLVLNLPEQDARETDLQLAAVLRWLQRNPGWFLIIDNVDSPAAQDAVRALTTRLPQGHILITSRRAEWPATFTALDLDVLKETASIALLLAHTEGRRTPRPDDPAAAAAIARYLDGLALALEQAAAWVRKDRRTFADYLAAWQAAAARLHAEYLTKGLADYHTEILGVPRSLLVTFDTSLAQLTPAARDIFRILSWTAPDPLPVWAVEKLSSLPAPRTLLVELADLHLTRLSPDGESSTVHRLLQEITRENQPELRPPALLKALAWIDELFLGEPTDVRTWSLLEPLAPHAQAIALAAVSRTISDPTARLLNQVAVLYYAKAQHSAAEPLYRLAIVLREESLGKNHPNVARAMNDLAQLLKTTNRLVEAEPLMRQVLTTLKLALGEDHPDVAKALNNLAQLLKATNRLAEAEPLMHRALAIDEAAFGMNHPKVAIRLSNLAALFYTTNRLAEAEPLMRQALDIDEAAFGMYHPDVALKLNNLAKLLKDTNHLTEAESLMRRALAIDEAALGSNHPKVAICLNNLARLLHATNRFSEAEPLMHRALAIDDAALGKDHPKVAIRLYSLARLFQDTNRLAEAEPLMHRAVGIFLRFTRDTGYRHPGLEDFIKGYRILLTETGRTEAQADEEISALAADYGVSV